MARAGWMGLLVLALAGPLVFIIPASRPTTISAEPEESPVQPIRAANVLAQQLSKWPRPTVVLVVTGRQDGYIEPCGCTGLDNQKGGLARRHSLITQLLQRGWTLVPVDTGSQVRRIGTQPEVKFQSTVDGLRQMGYRAVALGPHDLRLGVGELLVAAYNVEGQSDLFLCANASPAGVVEGARVIQAGGMKVGIAAILGDEHVAALRNGDLETCSAEEGLAAAWRTLEAARCDFHVLLAHASIDQSRALAQRFPRFDLVVTAGGVGEPTFQPEPIPGTRAVMIQVGIKGMHTGLVGLFPNQTPRLRYVRVALDSSFPDSRAMLDLLAAYQDQLQTLGLEGLSLRPVPHPRDPQKFVGSGTCGECHTKAYAKWSQTPHAHATDSIAHPTERSEIARHFDPECLSCHVTGWNPQRFFPYESGYLDLEASAHLHGNGCENCHGPGSAHVAAESGDTDVSEAELMRLRTQMKLPLAQARDTCLDCHDLDNSPDFHRPGAFERYWDQIEHRGKD